MSCDSPYIIPLTTTELFEYDYEVTYKGSIKIPGETIDGVIICVPTYTLPEYYCPSKSGKTCYWWGTVCKGLWDWNCQKTCKNSFCDQPSYKDAYWGWCCCKEENGVQVYPDLNISYIATIPMNFKAQNQFVMTVDPPPTGLQTASIVVNDFDLSMNINGDTTVISIKEDITFTYSTESGWSATLQLTGVNVSTVIDDLKYEIGFTFYLLFCAEPEGGMSWLNLEVESDLKVISDGDTLYGTEFSVACPITDVT